MPPRPRRTTLAAAAVAVLSCGIIIRQTEAFGLLASTYDVSSKSCSTFTSITSPCSDMTSSTPCSSSSTRTTLTMKISSKGKRNRSNKSSYLIERNNERLTTAGKPGSKSYIDPNKLFIGNLPFDATEHDIQKLFAKVWGVPLTAVDERIESIKIIRDWKTGQSKGYGFLQFYEPMVATSTMLSVNQDKNGGNDKGKGRGGGWKIKGRVIRLDQGQRNRDEEEAELKRKREEKKKRKEQQKREKEVILDEEGMVIHGALEGVEGLDGEVEEEEGMMSEDDMITFMEKGGLRGVMPLTMETAGFLGIEGLYDDDDDDGIDDEYYSEYYSDNGYNDEDWGGLDEDDEDENDEDLENFVYDGDFEAEYNPNEYESLSKEEEEEMKQMNREQRRAAEKRRKKRKLPFKGFGAKPN